MSENWDLIYKQYGSWLQEPHNDMPKVVELFLQNRVKTVLDIGCGAGRHVVYLAGHGFTVFGLDSSDEAVKMSREALNKIGLKANLMIASMYEKLLYPANHFDAIICTKALNHNTIDKIRRTIAEMERVLKPGGVVFIVVTKSRKILPNMKQKREAEIIAERTLIPKTGREIGVIHFQFNKQILLGEFRNFEVVDCHVDSERNYCLLGILTK
jgi:ubiquinone/menaquinone biosynthesis C-methylase UbiE